MIWWEWLITIFLLIVVGIPFMIVLIIPSLIYLGAKKKWIPSFEFLIQYFEVDVTKEPYSKWMDKHPLIFIGLTAIELYISWAIIKIIGGIKFVIKKIASGIWKLLKLFAKLQKDQYDRWDKEFEDAEKEKRKKK